MRAGDIGQKTRGSVGCKPLLNGDAFLHDSQSFTSLSVLQLEHVADDDHTELPFHSATRRGTVRSRTVAYPPGSADRIPVLNWSSTVVSPVDPTCTSFVCVLGEMIGASGPG